MLRRSILTCILLLLFLSLCSCTGQNAQPKEIELPKDCVVTNLHIEAISRTEIQSIKMDDVFWHVVSINWYYAESEYIILQGPTEVRTQSIMRQGRFDFGNPLGLIACQTEKSAKDYLVDLEAR